MRRLRVIWLYSKRNPAPAWYAGLCVVYAGYDIVDIIVHPERHNLGTLMAFAPLIVGLLILAWIFVVAGRMTYLLDQQVEVSEKKKLEREKRELADLEAAKDKAIRSIQKDLP